jgi:hypothetical protein
VNSKRHNIQIAIANAKHAIVRDMDEFSRELANTKESLSATQAVMFGTIKERLQATYDANSLRMKSARAHSADLNASLGDAHENQHSASREQMNIYTAQLIELVANSGFQSAEELIVDLEQSEDQIFNCYNEIQEKNVELEKFELENKALETQLSEQMSKLDALEKYNSKVRQELEQHINQIQLQIAKYDSEYAKSLEVLNSISDSLIILLKNVSIDGEATDQHILSTGITDRNIDEYLGIVEQRIDDLIQMANAAAHHPLAREDFLRMAAADQHNRHTHHYHGQFGALRPPPTLPSLTDADINDDTNDFLNFTNMTAGTNTNLNNTLTSTTTNATGGNLNAGAGAGMSSNDNDPNRIQPINIAMLKEHMARKMTKQQMGALQVPTHPVSGKQGGANTVSPAPGLATSSLDSIDKSSMPVSPTSRAKKALGSPVSFDLNDD